MAAKFMNLATFARKIKRSATYVRNRLIKTGELKVHRMNRAVLIDVDDAKPFIESFRLSNAGVLAVDTPMSGAAVMGKDFINTREIESEFGVPITTSQNWFSTGKVRNRKFGNTRYGVRLDVEREVALWKKRMDSVTTGVTGWLEAVPPSPDGSVHVLRRIEDHMSNMNTSVNALLKAFVDAWGDEHKRRSSDVV